MSRPLKPHERSVHALTIADFDVTSVWDTEQWDVGGGIDLTVVPLHGRYHLDGLERFPWIRVHGSLADGTFIQGIGNVSFNPPRIDGPSLFVAGKWHSFLLPPAPASVLAKRGPTILASQLGRTLEAVFPITLQSEVPYPKGGQVITTVFEASGARGA